jgi:hypothetical protein
MTYFVRSPPRPTPENVMKTTSKTIVNYMSSDGSYREIEYNPADTTWVYGLTEEVRQVYIERLIKDRLLPKELENGVIHVDTVTKRHFITGAFLNTRSKIVIIHNLKKSSIDSLNLCRIIDGDEFFHKRPTDRWRRYVSIYPDRVYISSEKPPEEIYANAPYKEFVVKRVTRVIKLEHSD